jgi:hypothetical protein
MPLQKDGKLPADSLCRRLVLPMGIESRPLTSLQQRLVKTGGRLIKHSRYHIRANHN